MEKAYEIGGLVEKLKGKGLDLAEDGAKHIVESVFEWLQESAILSETPYDNMALVVYPSLKVMALGAADKIDGKVG